MKETDMDRGGISNLVAKVNAEKEWDRVVQLQQLRQMDTLICLFSAALAAWREDDEDFGRCVEGVAISAANDSKATLEALNEIANVLDKLNPR